MTSPRNNINYILSGKKSPENLQDSKKTLTFAPAYKQNVRDLAQLVAHTSGGREVAGSSPVIPTEWKRLRIKRFLVFFVFIGFLEVTLGDVMGDFQSQPRSQPRFMEATISVICNKFKVLKNGESPIMVRVAKDGKRSMIRKR